MRNGFDAEVTEQNKRELTPASTEDRKTVDLCGHEHHRARCIRESGHQGQHESFAWDGSAPVHWD